MIFVHVSIKRNVGASNTAQNYSTQLCIYIYMDVVFLHYSCQKTFLTQVWLSLRVVYTLCIHIIDNRASPTFEAGFIVWLDALAVVSAKQEGKA